MAKTAYSPALNAALDTTRSLLFSPFQLSTWLVLGFSAWLSGITPASFQIHSFFGSPDSGLAPAKQAVHEGLSAFHQNPVLLLTLTGIGLILLTGFIAVTLWIQSRSVFVFLDGVVSGHAEVAEPWKAWKKEGNSFFRWLLGFSFLSLFLIGVWALGLALIAATISAESSILHQPALLAALLLVAILFLLTLFVLSSITLIQKDFIIPLMALHHQSAWKTWKLFFPILTHHLAGMTGYIFLRIGLGILVSMGTTVITLAACCLCCAGLLLAFPYVGTVILLPIPVFFRAFSLHFLAQYGNEYNAWKIQRPVAAD